jgi:hypothetical protein
MTHLEDAVGPSSLAPTTRICGRHQASSRVPTGARQPEWCGVRTCVEATVWCGGRSAVLVSCGLAGMPSSVVSGAHDGAREVSTVVVVAGGYRRRR